VPLVIAVTPGRQGTHRRCPDCWPSFGCPSSVLASRAGTPQALRGDKPYSARAHRAQLRARGIKAVIPQPADQVAHRKRKGSHGGRPVAFDAEDYKNRNVVEPSFNRLKNWRGIATRYDKHALAYCGGVVLAAIILWLS